MFETILNAVNQVWSPMSYQYIRSKDGKGMSQILLFYILLAYTLTFLYSLWSREIYSILISNEEIASTYKYSIILAMALNYRPLYVYCINYFIYHERTVQILGITLMAGTISCVYYFMMVPFWGITAALSGFYLGCLYMGYSGYLHPHYKRNSIFRIRWFYYLAIQLLLTWIVYHLVEISIYYKIIVTICYIIAISIILSRSKLDVK